MSSQNLPDMRDLQQPLIPSSDRKSDGQEKLTIDEMLQKYCGEFGKWQLKHFIVCCWAI